MAAGDVWNNRWLASWGDSWAQAGAPSVLQPGTVPICVVVGTTANVVPVEFVGTDAPGVVPVREYAAGPNVVNVREAGSETPRVKVRRA